MTDILTTIDDTDGLRVADIEAVWQRLVASAHCVPLEFVVPLRLARATRLLLDPAKRARLRRMHHQYRQRRRKW